MSDIDFSGFDLVLEESAKDRMTVNERVLTPLIHNRLFEVFFQVEPVFFLVQLLLW